MNASEGGCCYNQDAKQKNKLLDEIKALINKYVTMEKEKASQVNRVYIVFKSMEAKARIISITKNSKCK